MARTLRFRDDGTFHIVQFTDLHIVDGSEPDRRTLALVAGVMEREKPDLAVLTGDLVCGEANAAAQRMVAETLNRFKTPWAAVFGNHDAEVGSGKETLLAIQGESRWCLTVAGDRRLTGLGNYRLTVAGRDGRTPAWTLFFLDSGNMNPHPDVGGYDYVRRDQIDWIVRESRTIRRQWGPVPSLLFLHIPPPEFNDAWAAGDCEGAKHEEVCCARQNSGLVSGLIETGDVRGVFAGHDHVNDYCGRHHGIRMCYGRATGFNTYGRDDFPRGARIIVLREGVPDFETRVVLER